MIFLLGASGYVGRAFVEELRRRNLPFTALSRRTLDYSNFETIWRFLRETKPAFLINSAGFTGKPNVDACELARADTLQGNTILPLTVAHACLAAGVPWGHVSSGCIYAGAWVVDPHGRRVQPDLMKPELSSVLQGTHSAIQGFSEKDEPNFSFRSPPCSFYSGSKALAEEGLRPLGQGYLWRLRIPFDEFDGSRNYLSKIQNYPKVYDNVNSLSHRGDFVRACLDLWGSRAPFGIYNVTNPGFVTTRHVVGLIQKILRPARQFDFWSGDEEFYRTAASTPRSNCVLDVSKLLATGVPLRPVEEALVDALRNWQAAS